MRILVELKDDSGFVFSADSFASFVGEEAMGQVSQLYFSFQAGLMALSCLLVMSIFAKKNRIAHRYSWLNCTFFTGCSPQNLLCWNVKWRLLQ